MTKTEKLKKGQKVAGTAFWLESVLVIAKVIAGLLSGSLVLISDAIHSASDILSIATSWIGLKIAQRKADKNFPYGYYKAENLGAAIISVFIIYASWKMLTQGYMRFFSFSSIKVPLLALSVSLFDALILFFFGKYEIKIGKQINAQSLIAMGKENKTHLFSSLAVFVGTTAAYYQVPYIEGVITIGISLLILKIGLTAGRDSVFALMDVSPGKEIEQKVIKAIRLVPGIEEFSDLRLRKSGPFYFGEIKVGIRKSVDVKRAHEMADKVEKEVKRKVSQVDSFMVHVEPFKSNWQHLVIPVTADNGLDSEIADQFARAPYFLFVNLKKDKLKGFYLLKNLHKEKKVKAGLAVAKLISKQKSDILITKQIGEIAFYALRENLFDIYQTEDKTVKKTIKNFQKSQLKQLGKATKNV
jgi:cation diffusion facilitator family transporter